MPIIPAKRTIRASGNAEPVVSPWPEGAWRRLLAEAISEPAELLGELALAADAVPPLSFDPSFPLRVPRSFVRRMALGDADDPLLRQVLPLAAEGLQVPGFGTDPLCEQEASTGRGLLHKYSGRVLLIATGACAVHCRYCFRRHFPYAENKLDAHLEESLDSLARSPGIEEVILSGGDPLMLTDPALEALVGRIAALGTVRRLRLHTRLPVVLPERVDGALLRWLADCPLDTVVVIHANHARELDQDVATALSLLRQTGATLLNQSVLLRGVNDRVEALVDLSRALFDSGVLPYYLHLLDPVAGAAHFDVPEEEARRLWLAVSAALPGYLVPRLVREVAGAAAKVQLGAAALHGSTL